MAEWQWKRWDAVARLGAGKLTLAEAARVLRLSVRQVRRTGRSPVSDELVGAAHWQDPITHEVPAGQMCPHEPQLLESVLRFTSHPSAASLLQLAKPGLQRLRRHVVGFPPQNTEPFGTGQHTEDDGSQEAPWPVGMHPLPQTFGVPPPPQVSGAVHAPQSRVPPQPSGTEPQLSPAGHVVRGVQPQTFTVPPPPQVWGAVQVPQLPPQPSSPHSLPVQSGEQHTPNFAPDSSTQTPLFPLVPQQLRLVRQTAPSALHPPAVALRCPTSASAATASSAIRPSRATCFIGPPWSRARGGTTAPREPRPILRSRVEQQRRTVVTPASRSVPHRGAERAVALPILAFSPEPLVRAGWYRPRNTPGSRSEAILALQSVDPTPFPSGAAREGWLAPCVRISWGLARGPFYLVFG